MTAGAAVAHFESIFQWRPLATDSTFLQGRGHPPVATPYWHATESKRSNRNFGEHGNSARSSIASALAINWGRFQDPPLLSTSPFHRFGVSIRARDETKRDRRIHRDEEQTLLAACLTMNTAEHRWTGPAMHDRIIAALETCCRQGEMLRMKNRDVDRTQHQILIRGVNAKDAENRRIPYDPKGRLAPILKRRAELGPSAFVFGSTETLRLFQRCRVAGDQRFLLRS